MKNQFETMHSSPTPAETCKGFTIINYKDISEDKSSRLCSIDASTTPEPYIVEVVTRIESDIHYKSHTFSELSDAVEYQSKL